MTAPPAFDVFFSHARADWLDPVKGPPLQALAAALAGAGLRVFRDEAEITTGQEIGRRIRDGLARSRLVLVWYSKDYPTRRACQWELTTAWLAAKADPGDASAELRRLLVVNPEPRADHLQPVDLAGILWISGGVPDPQAVVGEVRRRLALVTLPLDGVRALSPPLWYGSNPRLGSERFVGRVDALWEVHKGLLESDMALVSGAPRSGSPDLSVVQGMGGIGKTLLAEEYALRFGPAWPGGIFWLGAAGGDRGTALARVGRALKLPDEELTADRIEGTLKEALAGRGRYLWVVDDLPPDATAEALVAWRAPTPNGATLVTTRNTRLPGHRVRLDRLADTDAHDLLTRRRPPGTAAEKAAAQAILRELDNHPLAVDVAGAAVARRGYATFLADLRQPGKDALDLADRFAKDLPTGHAPQIAATLLSSVQRLGPEGRRLLDLAALLAPDPIPKSFIADVFARLTGEDGSWAADSAIEEAAAEALAEVIPGVEASADAVRIHILVTRTLRFHHATPPDGLADAALAVLTDLFAERAPDIRAHGPLLPLLPHARSLIGDAENEPKASLLGWLGWVAQKRGAYGDALADYGREEAVRRRVLGPEHPDTLTSMNNLAESLGALGDHAGARTLHEQVLGSRRRVLGPEHPDTLTSMNNLAETLRALGDHPVARKLHEQVMEALRRVLGPEHPNALSSMNNLALTLRAGGDLPGAQALHEQVLDSRRRVLGPEHPDTLRSMNNLAGTLWSMGDHPGARILEEQVLDSRRRVLGPEHPDTLGSMNNLAHTLVNLGDTDAARALVREAVSIAVRTLGPQVPIRVALEELARHLGITPGAP